VSIVQKVNSQKLLLLCFATPPKGGVSSDGFEPSPEATMYLSSSGGIGPSARSIVWLKEKPEVCAP
jgi:hypothetical protein